MNSHLPNWVAVCYVACGGAIGSVLRFGMGRWIGAWFGTIPSMFATGLVNLIGSFVLGWVVASFAPVQRVIPNPLVLFLGVGLCGGLTTFSTLAMELTDLLQAKRYGWTLVYGLGSLTLGVLSFLAGAALRVGEINAD